MPSLIDRELQRMLDRVGIKPGALYKLRFGGVVGKMALVALGVLGVIVVIAWRAADVSLFWGCLGGAVAIGIFGIGAILFFAHKHPEQAMLDGAQLVALQHLKNQAAFKGAPELPDQPLIAQRLEPKALNLPKEGEPT